MLAFSLLVGLATALVWVILRERPVFLTRLLSAAVRRDAPDAYLFGGVIYFGRSFTTKATLSRGIVLSLPELNLSTDEDRQAFQSRVKNMLMLADETTTLQVHWLTDSDYKRFIDKYEEITDTRASNPITNRIRRAVSTEARAKLEAGELRLKRTVIFMTRTVETGASISGFSEVVEQAASLFDQKRQALQAIFPDAHITSMGDDEHIRFFNQLLRPSMTKVPSEIDPNRFDKRFTVTENLWPSDFVGEKAEGGAAFRMDGQHQAILVLTSWPAAHEPMMFDQVTNSVADGLHITQTIFYTNSEFEIRREEQEMEKMRKLAISESKPSLISEADMKEMRIQKLSQGSERTYRVLTVLRLWADTAEKLNVKIAILKSALNGMESTGFLHVQNPVTAKNLFYEQFPGYTFSSYRGFDMPGDSDYLASLVPLGATFTGFLEEGECLFFGEEKERNLIGFRTFSGGVPGTPEHTFLCGVSGAGKSVGLFSILAQSECFYDFTAIIEEGNNFGFYTKALGKETTMIQQNGTITMNPFDTDKMPFSPDMRGDIAALFMKMVGSGATERENKLTFGLFGEYVDALIDETWSGWWRAREEADKDEVVRQAMLMGKIQSELPSGYNTFTDAFVEMMSRAERNPEWLVDELDKHDAEAVADFQKSKAGRIAIRDLSYAYFAPEEYPTLSQFVEKMRVHKMNHHDAKTVNDLVTLLSAWKSGAGANGVLFDGVTNHYIDRKHCHFELGLLPDTAKDLKEVAVFLIANKVRRIVVSMPRGTRKRIIYEEVARFLGVQGGEEIVKESYAQLRKYGCWCCTSVQLYAQFKNSAAKESILGNSPVQILFAQGDAEDLEDLAKSKPITPSAKRTVLGYRLPKDQPKNNRASYFLINSKSGEHGIPICGTVRFKAQPEILAMAVSSGAHYDRAIKIVANIKDEASSEAAFDALIESYNQG